MLRTVFCNTIASFMLEWQVLHWTASQCITFDLQIKESACGQQGAWKNITALQHIPLKYELLLHDLNKFHPFYGFVSQKSNFSEKLAVTSQAM